MAVAFFLAPLAGILLLFFGSGPSAAAIATVLVGAGLGAEVSLVAFLLSRYFGMRAFGEIYGYLFALFMLGAGAGPFAMGVSYDVTGSYQLMLAFFAIALLLASGLTIGSGILCVSVGISALSGWMCVLGSSITCRAVEGQRSSERAIVKEELVWVFGTISATGSSPRRFDCNSVREPNRGRRPRQSLVHTDELPPFGRSPHDKCRRQNARHRAPEHRAGPIALRGAANWLDA